jgi:hypothetical protein
MDCSAEEVVYCSLELGIGDEKGLHVKFWSASLRRDLASGRSVVFESGRKYYDLGGVKKEMLSAYCIEGEEAMFLTFEGIVQTNKFG